MDKILYTARAVRKSRKKGATNMYLTLEEKKKVMKECGDAGLILLEYYLENVNREGMTFKDEYVANSLGWSVRKVQEYRRVLTKKGYFYRVKGKYSDGTRIITTYVGKDAVTAIKNGDVRLKKRSGYGVRGTANGEGTFEGGVKNDT